MCSYGSLILASLFPRKASLRLLRRILVKQGGTQFGRDHSFNSCIKERDDEKLLEAFRANVEPSEYEDVRPYVEEFRKGGSDVLFGGRPVMYATTSGTTDAPKWIPVSDKYIHSVHKIMDYLWVQDIIHKRPLVLLGKVFAVSSRSIEGYGPDGVPYGSVSGMLKDRMSHFVSKRYVIPSCVYSIKDYNARYYVLMRLALGRQVTSILTANPSTFSELISAAQQNFPCIIKDIEQGTVSHPDLEPEIASLLHVRPDRRRGRQLAKLYRKYGSGILPKHYWPHIQLVGTWRCGNAEFFFNKVRDSFPKGALFQDCGYFASECRMGLALRDNVYSLLFPHLNFYEFVHESQLDSRHKCFLLPDELKRGERYCPYVTTWSGLYRYNMNDLVEAGPRFMRTPMIRMVQKINGIVSITGEKLYESQFLDAVRHLYREAAFSIGIANIRAQRYDFFFEPVPGTDVPDMRQLASAMDIDLKLRNSEYRAKRDSLRLHLPLCHVVPEGTARNYRQYLISKGRRDGQLKHVLLLQDDDSLEYFSSL